jgi:hypothetical protein
MSTAAMLHASELDYSKSILEVIAKEIEEKMKRSFLCDYEKW